MPFYVGNVISRAFECDGVGIVDPTFIDPNIDNTVNDIAVQPDGKIVVAGAFTNVAGVTKNSIARLNNDGTLDTTFNIGANPGGGTVEKIAIQPDGKIVLVGRFSTMRGVTKNRVARLNTDGSLDTTFNIGANIGANGNCFSVAIQPDGKVLVGGIFTTMRGVTQNRIARLNTDGSLDTGFNTGANPGVAGASDNVRDIVVQPDGKILIGGGFVTARGVTQNGFARLETDGSLDTGFNTGANPGIAGGLGIYDMALQDDGKIVIVGDWQSFRNTTLAANCPELSRSNTDGTRDTTWATGPTPNNGVLTCELQYDGKIFTGGFYVNMRGRQQNFFSRLLDDGTDDAAYNVAPPTVGATQPSGSAYVLCSALQDDCKILIGGQFTEVRGITRTRLARLA